MLPFAGHVSICRQPVGQAGVTVADTPAINGNRANPLVGETGLTVTIAATLQSWTSAWLLVPITGFALEIDGRIKTEFDTKEGAESGAIALKRRFPDLRVLVYDANTKSRYEVQA